jgi:hypothetical protein
MRILRLDVSAIIACNARRMVRSDPSAGGFFLERRGFGLGSQYTFGRLFGVYTCGRVFANKESSGNEYLSVRHVRNDWADPRIRGSIRSVLVYHLYNSHYITRVCTRPKTATVFQESNITLRCLLFCSSRFFQLLTKNLYNTRGLYNNPYFDEVT